MDYNKPSSDGTELPEWFFQVLPPDKDGLYEMLRPMVSNQMVDVIAQLDYGNHWLDHRDWLRRLRDGWPGHIELGWIPGEVLELGSNRSSPESLDEHIQRAFCCCLLIRHGSFQIGRDIDPTRLNPLVNSLPCMPDPYRARLLGVISHVLSASDTTEEVFDHFLGSLLKELQQNPTPFTPRQVQELHDWAEETAELRVPKPWEPTEDERVSLLTLDEDRRREMWGPPPESDLTDQGW